MTWIIAGIILIVPNIIGPYFVYLAYQRGWKNGFKAGKENDTRTSKSTSN